MSDELAVFGGEKTVTAETPIWPRFSDEDIDAATWALNEARTKRDFISASFGGEGLEAFEADFAEFLGADHVVSVNSGCAAIHVALMAAGVNLSATQAVLSGWSKGTFAYLMGVAE